MDSCMWKYTADGQLAGGGTAATLSIQAKVSKSFYISPSPFHILSCLSHSLHVNLLSFICTFSLQLCVLKVGLRAII